MQFEIPSRFKLLGQTIEVSHTPSIATQNGTLGEARFFQNTITLQENVAGWPVPESQKGSIFWHEAVHMMFTAIGQDKLSEDEALVDLIGAMIYQIISTMEYTKEKKHGR